MNTIELINTTIGYRLRSEVITIAEGINGSFHKGEMVCLLGRNGMGKSTLLRTIANLQPALGGCIRIEGQEISSYTMPERARLMSLVATEKYDLQGMKVYDLVALGRSPYTGFWGRLNKHDKKIVMESLQLVGMEEYAERDVQTLSDGERQKVFIAKAIAQETPIIILDEPTAFLDYPSKVKTMKLLYELAHNLDKLIILSTHDLEQALAFSDCIWLLDKELGLTIGTAEELKKNGTLRKYFDVESRLFSKD